MAVHDRPTDVDPKPPPDGSPVLSSAGISILDFKADSITEYGYTLPFSNWRKTSWAEYGMPNTSPLSANRIISVDMDGIDTGITWPLSMK